MKPFPALPFRRYVKGFVASAIAICSFTVGLMVLPAGTVSGQDYPNKPIRIVTGESGGGSDLASRLIAQGLTSSLGQQVVVDNRGGNVVIPAVIVAKAAPDGYTFLCYGNPFWISPLMQKVSYDTLKDFSPVTLTVSSPNLIVVHPSIEARSVKELIVLAKARPGDLNYAASTTGSTPHLAGELFKAMAGVNIMAVPYKGGGPAITALIGGQVQLMFPAVGFVMAHVKSGRLTALAITSAQPSILFPGLPTVAASGLPGYEAVSPFGIFAPAKTPEAIIERLNREIVRMLNRAEVKERFFNAGVETIASSPEQLGATIKREMAKWGKVIKDAGIRVE